MKLIEHEAFSKVNEWLKESNAPSDVQSAMLDLVLGLNSTPNEKQHLGLTLKHWESFGGALEKKALLYSDKYAKDENSLGDDEIGEWRELHKTIESIVGLYERSMLNENLMWPYWDDLLSGIIEGETVEPPKEEGFEVVDLGENVGAHTLEHLATPSFIIVAYETNHPAILFSKLTKNNVWIASSIAQTDPISMGKLCVEYHANDILQDHSRVLYLKEKD